MTHDSTRILAGLIVLFVMILNSQETMAKGQTPPKQVFFYNLGTSVDWEVAFSDNLMIAAGSDESSGMLYAIDVKTKKLAWKAPTNLPKYKNNGAPLLVGDRVILPGYTNIAAYRVSNGERIWQSAPGNHEIQDHVVASSGVIVAGVGFSIRGFNSATGTEKWSYPIDNPGPPVIYNTWALASSGGSVQAIDIKTGKKSWSLTIPGLGISGAQKSRSVLIGDTLYLVLADSMISIDLRKRVIKWKASSGGLGFKSLGVAGGILATSTLKNFVLMDPATGKTLAERPIGKITVAGGFIPQILQSSVIYGSMLDDSVAKISRKDAKTAATLKIDGRPNAAVKIDQYIFVSTTAGVVQLLP